MLQQLIRRAARPPAPPGAVSPSLDATAPGRFRRSDWLLGGAVATLAVVFVAGLLGLRSSTADLQDQSRANARDLSALKADTTERLNGIAGDLARTNQTLTDLTALRREETAPSAASEPPAAKAAAVKPAAAKIATANTAKATTTKAASVRATTVRAVTAEASPPQPVARPDRGLPTVRRKPTRERTAQAKPQAATPGRSLAARRPGPPPSARADRLRREVASRQLRLRRLARRGSGSQPL